MFLAQATVMATLCARGFSCTVSGVGHVCIGDLGAHASGLWLSKYLHLLCTRKNLWYPGYVMAYILQNTQNLVISCFCFPRDGYMYALYKEL